MGIHDGHREKMRRRFQETGLEGFADHEALELLLYYAIPRRDTNELAHRLLARYGSLSALLQAPIEDLRRVEGVGESAAVLLKLVPAFVYKAQRSAGQETVLNSTEKAGRYLLSCFAGERNEVIYQLCLDRKGKLLARKRLSEGGSAAAELNIRRLVENALLSSASAVILSHNHPSGIALPSREDYATTQQAQDALRTIGVELLDHIIVAEDDYVSLADSGILRR
ncbi:MAG: DNA repair protein RadC [Dysosmobacter sp.]|nr:DNA repair protein RadC [Dysosmobacter sp.]